MTAARTAFHHGDLRAALVHEGLVQARTAGTDAVVLRAATRAVGVTPRAAYRHFADRDALVRAVSRAALAEMAIRIEERQARADDAVELLTAVGTGYIAFAIDEPGWFDVAFFAMADMLNTTAPEAAGPAGRSPYQQLHDALDALVADGRLTAHRVGPSAVLCWSGVHGFATLATRGPLRGLPRRSIDAQAQGLVADLVNAVVDEPSA